MTTNNPHIQALISYFSDKIAQRRKYISPFASSPSFLKKSNKTQGLSKKEETSFLQCLENEIIKAINISGSATLINDYEPQYLLRSIVEKAEIKSASHFAFNSGFPVKLTIKIGVDFISIFENGVEKHLDL